MKQVRAFDSSKGGSKPYYCLQNVRLGFSIPPHYDDAWTAWQNTEQHKNRTIPTGVDVPLYYSFTATIGGVRKNWGHINVRYRDGRVWNDGKWFSSLSAFEKAYTNVSYVGWGESVNKVKVIEENSMVTKKDVVDYFTVWLKRSPTASQITHYTKHHWRTLVDDVLGNYRKTRDKEVATLKSQNTTLSKKVLELGNALEICQKNNGTQTNADISHIRSVVDKIWAKISSIFK